MPTVNWIKSLEPLKRGGWYWNNETGKFTPGRVAEADVTPWYHNDVRIPGIHEAGTDCSLLTMFHNFVMAGQHVHSFCANCYKVVVVPESLEQVRKLAKWQQSTDWACKAGAEKRSYTQRVWGGYFYCRGVEEGRKRYKQVRKWVDENLGADVKVFLKRACTEFEQHMGDSDKWEPHPLQEEIEKEFSEYVEYVPVKAGQSDVVKHAVLDLWDEWDSDNKPPVTYHEEETSEGDE